jgi:Big-like domain-containing protein
MPAVWHRGCRVVERCAAKGELMQGKWLRIIAVVVGVVSLTAACAPTSPTTVSSVAVSGSAPAIGGTSQLIAMATLADGTTQNVSTQATWQSSNTAIATVSSTGIVTGVSSGTAVIQATYLTITGSDQLAVQ